MMHPHKPHGHHLRFYIVMATLVIGGILFLLTLNDNNDFGITSAMIGINDNTIQEDEKLYLDDFDEGLVDLAIKEEEVEEKSKTVDIELSFNKIPTIQKEAKIQNLVLSFDGLTTTTIKLNNDKLELNNLDEAILNLAEFSGNIDFDEEGLSLNGIARRIEVNGVAFSSEEEIKISFSGLEYKDLAIDEIELENLYLEQGEGDLQVSDKLSYLIKEEQIKMYYFKGSLQINKGFNTSINLAGDAKGISVSGEELSLNLR